jgi:hypothetical protein
MLVEVKPIDRDRWHGKKGTESFARPQVITPLYDSKTGNLATGLTAEDEKYYSQFFPGESLIPTFNPEEPHKFWESERFQIKLPNYTVIFDDKIPLQALQIKVLKTSKYVANSMREVLDGLCPDATHVIFDENEEIEGKAKKIEIKNTAVDIVSKMTLEEKINIIQIIDNKSLRHQSTNFVTVAIDEIIENKAEQFVKVARMDKATLYLQAVILEAIHRGTLRKEQGGSIMYMDEKLGFDLDSTVEYLNNPDNQQLKVKILAKLNE